MTAMVLGLGLVLLVAALLVVRLAGRHGAGPAAAPVPLGQALDPPAAPEALVFVSGAVAQPGLYRVPTSARLADAVAAAGGMTSAADTGRLPDLAATVHDGRQVNIPFRRSAATAGGPPARGDRIDVNSATVADLRAVPGMPVGLPEAIVDARTVIGAFATLGEVRTTLGIDAVTFAGLRPYLRAGSSTR